MASAHASSMACSPVLTFVVQPVSQQGCTSSILPSSSIDVAIIPVSTLLVLGRPVSTAHASHTSLLIQYGA